MKLSQVLLIISFTSTVLASPIALDRFNATVSESAHLNGTHFNSTNVTSINAMTSSKMATTATSNDDDDYDDYSDEDGNVVCGYWYKLVLDSYRVTGIEESWGGDDGAILKKHIKKCGTITAWRYEMQDNYEYKLNFNLPIATQKCVAKALTAAGSPNRVSSCKYTFNAPT